MSAVQIAADCPFSAPALKVMFSLIGEKLGRMEVMDRDDARELRTLENARAELLGLLGIKAPAKSKGRGRRAG